MATITFNEIDNTLSTTVKNSDSNFVFCPINSTWGSADLTEVRSLYDLKANFGEDAEIGGDSETGTIDNPVITSYQYASDILRSGLSLLVKRMISSNSTRQQEAALGTTIRWLQEETTPTPFTLTYCEPFTGIGYKSETQGSVTATKVKTTNNFFIKVDNNYVNCTEQGLESGRLASIYALSKGSYGNKFSMSFTSRLLSVIKSNVEFERIVSKTESGVTTYSIEKYLESCVTERYYVTIANVYIDGVLKEQCELGTFRVYWNPGGAGTIVNNWTVSTVSLAQLSSQYFKYGSDGEGTAFNMVTSLLISNTDAYSRVSSKDTFTDGQDLLRRAVRTETNTTDEGALEAFKDYLSDCDELLDKWAWDIKFVSDGGYTDMEEDTTYGTPSATIANGLALIAQTRADCVAFLDHPKIVGASTTALTVTNIENWAKSVATKTSYAVMYSPWCYSTPTDSSLNMWMPPSYFALTNIGRSFSSGLSICDVPAGVNRGAVSIQKPQFIVTSSVMERWQKGGANTTSSDGLSFCINPIMTIRNYGYCIFGQRNMLELGYGANSALQELGVRLTLNEIKKWVRTVAIGLTFESNTNRTWNQFDSRVSQCLDTLVQGGFLTQYSIIRESDVADQINSNAINATIQVYVTRALENFNINIEIESGTLDIEEETES